MSIVLINNMEMYFGQLIAFFLNYFFENTQ